MIIAYLLGVFLAAGSLLVVSPPAHAFEQVTINLNLVKRATLNEAKTELTIYYIAQGGEDEGDIIFVFKNTVGEIAFNKLVHDLGLEN